MRLDDDDDDDNDHDEWGSETRCAKRGRIKLDVPLAMPKRMLVAAWRARHVFSPTATTLRAWDLSSSRPAGRRISRPPAPNPAPALLAKFPQIRMSGKVRGDLLACSCVSAAGRQTANINPSLGMASPSKQGLMCQSPAVVIRRAFAPPPSSFSSFTPSKFTLKLQKLLTSVVRSLNTSAHSNYFTILT